MPLVKVSELEGAALDWAVATCEGKEIFLDRETPEFMCLGEMNLYRFSPTTYWAQGGPIIERERVCVDIGHDGVWLAYSKQNYADDKRFMHSGPTPLIAAMRCYVASKLGESIEIPEELT